MKWLVTLRAWRWQGNLYSSARTSADKKTKVQNIYKSSSKNFQPGTTDEQRTKVDETHVSPAIAKPNVIGIFTVVHRFKRRKIFLSLKQ